MLHSTYDHHSTMQVTNGGEYLSDVHIKFMGCPPTIAKIHVSTVNSKINKLQRNNKLQLSKKEQSTNLLIKNRNKKRVFIWTPMNTFLLK